MSTKRVKQFFEDIQQKESWEESVEMGNLALSEFKKEKMRLTEEDNQVEKQPEHSHKTQILQEKVQMVDFGENDTMLQEISSITAENDVYSAQNESEIAHNQNSADFVAMLQDGCLPMSESNKRIIEKIKEQAPTQEEFDNDFMGSVEKMFQVLDSQLQEEYDEYIKNGGKPEDFQPDLIPRGMVYSMQMSKLKRQEQEKIKAEKKLSNRFKKWMEQRQTKKLGSFENVYGGSKLSELEHETQYNIYEQPQMGSDKIKDKYKSVQDKRREINEENAQKDAEMALMGLPIDVNIEKEASLNLGFKIVGASMILSGLLNFGSDYCFALTTCGIITYASAMGMENATDLKYRKAVHNVREAFLRCRGDMTPEDVAKILHKVESKLPDEYDLACMTNEDREALLASSNNPQQLSKKQLVKHINKELREFMYKQNEKMFTEKENDIDETFDVR